MSRLQRSVSVMELMNPDYHNPVLEKHTFTDASLTLSFYTYYNDNTQIYYELEPLIKPMRLVSVDATIKHLPFEWVKNAIDFNDDDLFTKAELLLNSAFVEVQ